MRGESSADGSEIGRQATSDAAGKKAWLEPRLTVIDAHDAQSNLTIASDGLYVPRPPSGLS